MDNGIPFIWQWVALVSGLVAFVMATIAMPSAFQMWFGRPRIALAFSDTDELEGQKLLRCCLVNLPVRQAFARLLGISRMPAEDVFLTVELFEAGTGKLVTPGFVPSIQTHFQQEAAARVRLPASLMASCANVIRWVDVEKRAYIIVGNQNVPLQTGRYLAIVVLHFDTHERRHQRLVDVGATRAEVAWLE